MNHSIFDLGNKTLPGWHLESGIGRGVGQSLSFMEATSLESLGGELDPDAGKVSVADLFSWLNFGANTPNPTSGQGTASMNIKTGFFVVIKVLCVASASSGCPLASMESCVLNCLTATSEGFYLFAQNEVKSKAGWISPLVKAISVWYDFLHVFQWVLNVILIWGFLPLLPYSFTTFKESVQ